MVNKIRIILNKRFEVYPIVKRHIGSYSVKLHNGFIVYCDNLIKIREVLESESSY